MHDWTGGMPAGGAPRVYLKSALQSLPRDICTTTTTFFAPGGTSQDIPHKTEELLPRKSKEGKKED